MPLRTIGLGLFGCISLIACSSAPIEPQDFAGKLKDKFTTDIRADGLKLFTYQASIVEQRGLRGEPDGDQDMSRQGSRPESGTRQGPMRQHSQGGREQGRNGMNKTEDLELWGQQVELGLTKTLEMTGYCRDGYFELSRYIESGRGEIRGECKDGATDADKQKFVRY
ncbi:hypothetical protein L9G16_15840 [Shewanella sp. A25]|nr:hypothetical protein [Shewanella shenzhenensis]